MTGISCLSSKKRLFPGSPRLCHFSPYRLSSQQSTPVLSLGSDLQSLSLSTQSPAASADMQANISGWEGASQHQSLCGILYTFPSAHLLLHSSLRLWSSLLSPPGRGCLNVWKTFLLHSFFPEAQVPSWFLSLSVSFSLFLLPYSIMGRLTGLFGSLWSSASFQLMFCSCFKCRCIFDVFVGMEGNHHVLLLCHLRGPPAITHLFFFIHLSVGGHLGGFHILSIVNNVAMKIAWGALYHFELVFWYFSDKYPRVELKKNN